MPQISGSGFEQFASLWVMLGIAVAVATVFVHCMFAIGIALDARRRENAGDRLEFVGSVTWCIATLLGGVFVAGIYWLMHRSSLRGVNES